VLKERLYGDGKWLKRSAPLGLGELHRYYYKLVWNDGGVLKSLYSKGDFGRLGNKASVVYKKGEWVRAPKWLRDKGYGPLVYGCFPTAFEQMTWTWRDIVELWTCQVRRPREGKDLPPCQENEDVSNGTLIDDAEARALENSWPGDGENIVMADEVMLVERLGVLKIKDTVATYKGVCPSTECRYEYSEES
jgi:hypothetical protein